MLTLRPLFRRLGRAWSPAARSERLAARHLRSRGYLILARNLRNRFGEIDILAQGPDQRTLVVVEVKSSVSTRALAPRPEQRVNHAKQRRLTLLACQVARRYRLTDRPIRFDVIGVDLVPHQPPALRHHLGAFTAKV